MSTSSGQAQNWLTEHPTEWQKITGELKSDDWEIRSAGFNELHRIGDKRNADVADALFALLDREHQYRDLNRDTAPLGAAPPEAWRDPYYSNLLGDCKEIFKGQPTAQRFRILASGTFNSDSPFAQDLGMHAAEHIPWLVQMSRSGNPYKRIAAGAILAHWVAQKKPPVSPNRAAAISALALALDDPFPDVAPSISFVLAESKDAELCTVLDKAAARRNSKGEPIQAFLETDRRRCTSK